MKVFFDTNVYVAEALAGRGAAKLIRATMDARWKIFASDYLLEELERVLRDYLEFSPRKLFVALQRVLNRSSMTAIRSGAIVPGDPKDSPILRAAVSCGADYLITNDQHLLVLNPFESLQIISTSRYLQLLKESGILK